ncbi:hypothetical protein [Nocardioides perillae]|uniref:Uncharacterized protein n=1 Tax=Nocardioides perillae TaxID=1119534 RepID=A0A7Y9RSW8_9ACTN|nr:hypothetical protein [Nocardioides perillae]NYG55987.1 hypothetical protein [Nocardioides perillae]
MAAGPLGTHTAAEVAGPTRWDACAPVVLHVDSDGAPRGWRPVVEAAVERISAKYDLDIRLGAEVAHVDAVATPADGEGPVAVLAWSDLVEEPALLTETAVTTLVSRGSERAPGVAAFGSSIVFAGTTPVGFALEEVFGGGHAPLPGAGDRC